jgi:orotidine-5'-phosphate decarboxylase
MINSQKRPGEYIIVALDVPVLRTAVDLAERLRDHVGCFKVGLELLTAQGSSEVISALKRLDVRIFYDAKFNDIPNTVAGASKAVSEKGAWMFTVHASTGRAALEAAARNKGDSKLLAVTVLTSLSSNECQRVFGRPSLEQVIEFAQLGEECGADGVVCAHSELEVIKQSENLRKLLCVVPGIRPTWANTEDQARYTTPKKAVSAGADYLVIGRPITQAPKSMGGPIEAVLKIIDEIGEVL